MKPRNEFKTASDFLIALAKVSLSPDDSWVFRGQADSRWKLEPSLFRADAIKDKKRFEQRLIKRIRINLVQSSSVSDRLLKDDDYILALAQHYGCPTRLLDWTRAPNQAAYFAAADALRTAQTGRLSVFALNGFSGLVRSGVKRKPVVHAVEPRMGGNDNMYAQRGVLLKHEWNAPDLWKQSLKFGIARMSSRAKKLEKLHPVVRFDLPAAQARSLLSILTEVGVDGASSFPGIGGFVRKSMDEVWP